MWFSFWLRNGKRSALAACRRTQTSTRQRANFQPTLEALEDRWLPSTLTVTTAADNSPGTPYVPGSLRQEISLAQNGDTIVFDPSLSGGAINLRGSELYIDKQLTIQGLGANNLAICGGGCRVFEVENAGVTLSGMTIEGGNGQPDYVPESTGGSEDGGGIFNGGTLALNGVVVRDNSTAANGGGIANGYGATLTITNSQVCDNFAWEGGGIYNYGNGYANGFSIPGGTVSISNSTVGMVTLSDGTILPGNTAPYGGGIANPSGGKVTVTNSTVDDNTGEYNYYGSSYLGQGGGLWNEGTMMLSGTNVTQNTSVVGGGIYNAGTLSILDSSVTDNTPDDLYSHDHVTIKVSYVGTRFDK